MKSFMSILVKVFTAITTVGMLSLTVWSLFSGQLFILTFASFLLACISGFFTYVDIKNLFFAKK